MKTTIRIARAELGNLFHSPIAWLLLAVFFIQVALAYLGKVENYVAKFETGENLRNLTYEFFADPDKAGIFITTVLDNLYLYIPLITMGLVSREKSSGTFKLLYSSPIKLSWIVLGKYQAMLFFNVCMISVLVIISVFASWHIDPLDWGMVASGLFGIFLLLSAYAAIGLFLSCLSNYQVVAAIATFGVFALFKYVGSLWQDYDVIRDITAYISISGRTETMISGLISTRDVLYYLFITAAFLLFAGFRLRAERVKERKLIYSLRYSVVAVVVVALGYVTSLPGNIGYWDTTHTLRNTLSTDGQKELDLLGDSALSITSYVNLLDPTYYKARPRDRKAAEKRWERYKRFKPDIRLNYVYYYDSTMRSYVYSGKNKGLPLDALAERFSKANRTDLDRYLTPDEIQERIDLYPENNRLVWQLKYQGKSTFLRTFNDIEFWPSETEIMAALRRLTITLPRVGFLQGQEERHIDRQGDRHYKLAVQEVNVRESLLNQGFDVEEVTLQTADDTIPEGLEVLVIADPRAAFAPEALKKLQQYIAGGGNAWIAGEPGKQHILNPLLEMLGVRMVDGTIVQGNTEFGPDEVESIIKSPALDFGNNFVSGLFMAPISTPSVAALDYTNGGTFTVRELFRTDVKNTWMKTGRVVLDSADMVFDPSGDVKQAFPTGLALTRQIDGREQRIVVTGDADFLSNAIIGKSYPRTLNSTFLKGFFSWFTDGKFPAEPFWPSSLDTGMTIRSGQISLLEWIMIGLIPGLIVLSGSVILFRRKRK